ncbi:MAG TPA: hypothetical protein DCE56_06590 [Cyanobacteria bacterium UBA8553]|nr:hypothetical protein [Cyanobacteria bacterium UBA8553]HAJ59296.1 hypothetical protein [Cyanobacteria bacterium UBA8543]
MTESTTIYWTSAKQQGNKYLQKLHPNMLKPEGHKVLRERTLSGNRTLKTIHYDVNFVVQKIVNEVLIPLEMDAQDLANWLLANQVLIEQVIDSELLKQEGLCEDEVSNG